MSDFSPAVRDAVSILSGLPHFVVAIDGPSGAGKSTIAKLAALALGIDYIDTGAMYRAVALAAIRGGVFAKAAQDEPADALDTEKLAVLLEEMSIDIAGGSVILDGEDVSGLIRTPEVTMAASRVSALPPVREKLVALQRDMGERKSVVMDGRDIGSNVFPGARFKFYITASPEERARRRYKEMLEKGMEADIDEVLADINKRDWDDSHRELNPLTKTDDAVEIITDDMTIDEVLAHVIESMAEKK